MTNVHNVLVINGSYRDDGITDQAIEVAVATLKKAGTKTEVINLRDYPIEFCLNCRECTQQTGPTPGKCVLVDGMQALIDKIEAADAFNFVAEEIDAIGAVGVVWVDVDQATTGGGLSGLFAERFGVVIEIGGEGIDQLGEGMRLPNFEREAALLESGLCGTCAEQGFGRGD